MSGVTLTKAVKKYGDLEERAEVSARRPRPHRRAAERQLAGESHGGPSAKALFAAQLRELRAPVSCLA